MRHSAWVLVVALALLALASCSDGSGARPTPARHPPIVMVVFDEFSTTSLLDRHGRIDPVRYPHFADFARDADWFPNATSSLDETARAMRALLTGKTDWHHVDATYRKNPRNLFTLLGRRYRMRASEEVSSLCPRRLCRNVRSQNQRSVLHELANGRPERVMRWLRSVRPARRPTLYFKHILLPHGPWVYVPSGHRYREGSQGHLPWGLRHFNRWLVNQYYQRHLLNLGFTDRLLGRVLDHLRATGLYDRSLVVVTADNGEGFGRLGNGHEISRRNAADIAVTPLLIKRPYQRGGRIVRRHVRVIDELPTIARIAHIRVPWRIHGRSIYGSSARRIPRSVLLVNRVGKRLRLSLGSFRRRVASTLRLKLRLFGSGPFDPRVFRIGPDRAVQGTPVSRWRRLAPSSTRAVIQFGSAFSNVQLGSELLPLKIYGRLVGPAERRHVSLAVAINGRIVATAPTFAVHRGGRQLFSVVVPESALHAGRNSVQLFAILRSRAGLELQSLSG